MSFEIGDVVVLKSGGPAMTVTQADNKNVMCIWYGNNNEYTRESFLPDCLVYADKLDDDDTGA